MILNLAVFFAGHTFWPQGSADTPFAGNLEWIQVVITAFIALWQYKADLMKVIGGVRYLGLIYSIAV